MILSVSWFSALQRRYSADSPTFQRKDWKISYNETLERQYLRSIPQQGKAEWIGIGPKRLLEVHSVNEVTTNTDTGLEGDHFRKSSTDKRQVTLIQQEHLDEVARILGKSEIPPELLRRLDAV